MVLTGPTSTPVLEVGFVPLQSEALPPLAVHDVALLLDQLKVTVDPVSTVGLALPFADKVTVGCTGTTGLTVTLVELGALVPPPPVQVNVYVTVPAVDSGPVEVPVLDEPLAPAQPSEPVPPLPVHEVAALVVHDSEAAWPAVREPGVAANVKMLAGAGATTVTLTDMGALFPPAPVQSNV